MKKRTVFFIFLVALLMPGFAFADNATISVTDNSTIILYYSKMGTTRIVADEVKTLIPSAEFVEIKSDVGIMKAVFWHQLFNRNAEIEPIEIDLTKYDRIIICSPIWFQIISSPARTVINTMHMQGKKMQLFITCGGYFGESGQKKLKKLVASKGIDLENLYIVKTGGKSEEEIRKQTSQQFKDSQSK